MIHSRIFNFQDLNIQCYVNDFIEYAKQNEHLKFYVTEIGCGLAG